MNDIYVGSLFSEDYLSHHGILGMKWGVRRFQNKDGSLTSEGKKRYSSTGDKKSASKKSNFKRNVAIAAGAAAVAYAGYKSFKKDESFRMSDEELERRVKRLEQQVKYLDLKSKSRPGKTYVTNILKDVGKRVVVTGSTGALLYAMKSAIDKQGIDEVQLGKAVFNGGASKKK